MSGHYDVCGHGSVCKTISYFRPLLNMTHADMITVTLLQRAKDFLQFVDSSKIPQILLRIHELDAGPASQLLYIAATCKLPSGNVYETTANEYLTDLFAFCGSDTTLKYTFTELQELADNYRVRWSALVFNTNMERSDGFFSRVANDDKRKPNIFCM